MTDLSAAELNRLVAVFALVTVIVSSVVLTRLGSIKRRLDRLSGIDAKLDALLKAGSVPFDPLAEVPASVREALARGEKILAIKRLRESTNMDLKQAKEAVEEIQRRSQPHR